jgi:hypothetical protein
MKTLAMLQMPTGFRPPRKQERRHHTTQIQEAGSKQRRATAEPLHILVREGHWPVAQPILGPVLAPPMAGFRLEGSALGVWGLRQGTPPPDRCPTLVMSRNLPRQAG